MASLDILYLILGVCVVVITVTVVWLANELIGLIKSLKHSAQDTEVVTKEVREKVLLVSEALDRAGTAATAIIGLIEDAIEQIKEKRDGIVSSIGLITGAGDYIKRKTENRKQRTESEGKVEDREKEESPKEEEPERPEPKEKRLSAEGGEKAAKPEKEEKPADKEVAEKVESEPEPDKKK